MALRSGDPGSGVLGADQLRPADTRALLNNGEPFPSVASNQTMTYNPDGTADVYFGPQAPAGTSANGIKTVPGRGYFIGMRLYSPTQEGELTRRPASVP